MFAYLLKIFLNTLILMKSKHLKLKLFNIGYEK